MSLTACPQGRQPDVAEIDKVGYLMRTTAVYGNGKFGLADRDLYCMREEAGGPFRVELLAVWLIRAFTVDIVEHMARVKGGAEVVPLNRDIRRRLGVGNFNRTGHGAVPGHPSRLAECLDGGQGNSPGAGSGVARSLIAAAISHFREQLDRAHQGLARWHTPDERQSMRVRDLAEDFDKLESHLETERFDGVEPWNDLYLWATSNLTLEGQEAVCSLMIEPHGELVDDLAGEMAADEAQSFVIDGQMHTASLLELARRQFDWALATDFASADQTARFWYVSEEKLEPRLGERHEEPGAELEQRLGIGREVAVMAAALEKEPETTLLAEFLLRHPEHRHAARRVQVAARLPYAEIHDNVLSANMMPIDMLRCKLAFFGASRFDPKSDRWVRITMYADAPFPDEIADMDADDWAWPLFDEVRSA